MKQVDAFVAVDGKLFLDFRDCEKHDLDCIGEELDGLLQIAVSATNGGVTRNDQYRMALELLNRRDEVAVIVTKLYEYLSGGSD